MEFLHDKGTMAICDRLEVDSSAPIISGSGSALAWLARADPDKIEAPKRLKADFQNLSKHFVWKLQVVASCCAGMWVCP